MENKLFSCDKGRIFLIVFLPIQRVVIIDSSDTAALVLEPSIISFACSVLCGQVSNNKYAKLAFRHLTYNKLWTAG